MPNNLKNTEATQFNGSNAAEMARRSHESHKRNTMRKKTMREVLEIMLAEEITDKSGKKMQMQEAVTVALLQKALKGNTRAYELIRDTVGEKPVEQIMVADIDSAVIDEVERMVKGK